MAPRRRSGGPMMLMMLGGGGGGARGAGTEPMMLVMPLSEEACETARAACLVRAPRAPSEWPCRPAGARARARVAPALACLCLLGALPAPRRRPLKYYGCIYCCYYS